VSGNHFVGKEAVKSGTIEFHRIISVIFVCQLNSQTEKIQS